MITPSELNEKSATENRTIAYLSEFNTFENKFDGHIKKGELFLLQLGRDVHFIIHDSENEFGSLEDVIEKYKSHGWVVKRQRSWSCLFVDVYLSLPQ